MRECESRQFVGGVAGDDRRVRSATGPRTSSPVAISLRWGPIVLRAWRTVLAIVGLCGPLTQAPPAVGQTASASLEFPLRAIAVAGRWGTNEVVAAEWLENPRLPLIPADYLAWLNDLRVNWVCVVVELSYDDSMDSTIERDTEYESFSDAALRQMIREFRSQNIDVYLTLAFSAHEAETAARPVKR